MVVVPLTQGSARYPRASPWAPHIPSLRDSGVRVSGRQVQSPVRQKL